MFLCFPFSPSTAPGINPTAFGLPGTLLVKYLFEINLVDLAIECYQLIKQYLVLKHYLVIKNYLVIKSYLVIKRYLVIKFYPVVNVYLVIKRYLDQIKT